MLHLFLTANAEEIVARSRAKVAARGTALPTEEELANGVALFLNQLIDRLRLVTLDTEAIEQSATLHGGELLAMGFTVSQVVRGYGDVCQVVTELATETGVAITASEFHTFNRCLDDAIANAVDEYERRRDAAVAREGAERLGVFAHELRNRVNVAMLAYTVLQDGTVGIGGSTSALLGQSLRELSHLVDRSVVGVRLDAGLAQRQRLSAADLIDEVAVGAALDARASGRTLTVHPVDRGVEVDADPLILSAALGNLLQNAFKFSKPRGQVSLRTTATAERVQIEVEDECGGLPAGSFEELFVPFSQRSAVRSGLGLGLSISRQGVEAMGGTLTVRDIPGKGCVFAIALPRIPNRASPT
jgi:signal transduction histidine kinase